ncbi:MAG: hypothetical protein K0Q49_1792 [Haloplasmataceae bacterium]|jgi:hypothetical protein|nr:hypothetical protein [Haloplasmataceae bacterium]
MKENKPILFINSASTNNFYQKNQFEYDSRKKNNNYLIKKNTQKIQDVNVNREQEKPIVETENNYIINEEQNTVVENIEVSEPIQNVESETTSIEVVQQEEDIQIEKPFANKIRLLTKRALLNRYVLVAIVLIDGEIEGLFKNSNNTNIVLETNGEDNNISIDEIEDIRIIRV